MSGTILSCSSCRKDGGGSTPASLNISVCGGGIENVQGSLQCPGKAATTVAKPIDQAPPPLSTRPNNNTVGGGREGIDPNRIGENKVEEKPVDALTKLRLSIEDSLARSEAEETTKKGSRILVNNNCGRAIQALFLSTNYRGKWSKSGWEDIPKGKTKELTSLSGDSPLRTKEATIYVYAEDDKEKPLVYGPKVVVMNEVKYKLKAVEMTLDGPKFKLDICE